jgi:deglycase
MQRRGRQALPGRVACVLAQGFEDSEFQLPCDALVRAGFEVDVIAAEDGKPLEGKAGKVRVKPNQHINKMPPVESYDALLIPGGHSPDFLRADPRFVKLVKAFETLQRPIFAICHGPQLLLTAGLVHEGRTLTAWRTVQGDLRYTGATVKDEPLVVDGTWVTSREPGDLPQFCRAMVQILEGVFPTREEDRAGALIQ